MVDAPLFGWGEVVTSMRKDATDVPDGWMKLEEREVEKTAVQPAATWSRLIGATQRNVADRGLVVCDQRFTDFSLVVVADASRPAFDSVVASVTCEVFLTVSPRDAEGFGPVRASGD